MEKWPAACSAACNTSACSLRRCWTRAVARATTCRCCANAIRTPATPGWTTVTRCWNGPGSAMRPRAWVPGSASWPAAAPLPPPSSMQTWRIRASPPNRWNWCGPTWPCIGTVPRTPYWPNCAES
ncbi:hypothetical protein G6F50_017385 [Rhizopus delemar]|uniref:Uncharacterized protein n=1 Tax=Rhizopus delemar TaxID=936053 RepID=A0A9P6XQ42_9FUNG|nr:hypothetical protein G6F50_017385 [Rhizopus delemar]